MSKKLQALADNDPRFNYYSNEIKYDQGHWLYCADGWINPNTETHCIHEDTVKEVLSQVADIEPCECVDCQKHKN